MKINKLLTKFNHDKGKTPRIKYIVIHYVGALGTAKGNCQWYAEGNKNASAHYFVGHDGEIWQSVEDKDIAWHCGSSTGYKHPKCRNENSIGIEMCVRKKNTATLWASDMDWYFEDATVQSTIELTRYLMDKYNIPAENVIRHYDVTGKICPNPYVHNYTKHTWDAFKAALTVQSFEPWTAKVINTKALNVRSTPNGEIIKAIHSVTVIGEGKDSDGDTWYKVQLGDGTVGYIWPKYLSR